MMGALQAIVDRAVERIDKYSGKYFKNKIPNTTRKTHFKCKARQNRGKNRGDDTQLIKTVLSSQRRTKKRITVYEPLHRAANIINKNGNR